LPPRPYVFFDVDDTLVQWHADWAAIFAQVAAEAGAPVTREQAYQALWDAFTTLYPECISAHARRGEASPDRVHEFWMDYDGQILASLGVTRDLPRRTARVIDLLTRPDAFQLYPEAIRVLDALRAGGVPLGIVTGRPVALPDLSRLGIHHYFHPVIDAFAARSAKSEGRMFRLAAEVAASHGLVAWHIGDSYDDDVLGARAAGLRPILVDRDGRHPHADCPRVADLSPLPALLLDGAHTIPESQS